MEHPSLDKDGQRFEIGDLRISIKYRGETGSVNFFSRSLQVSR